MVHYNFNETYITESFFDDIDNDITDTSDDLSTLNISTVLDDQIKEINQLLSPIKFNVEYYTDKQTAVISHIERTWASIQFTTVDQLEIFQKMLDILSRIGCKALIQSNMAGGGRMIVESRYLYAEKGQRYEIDFHNINIPYICTKFLTLKNFFAESTSDAESFLLIDNCQFDSVNIGKISNIDISYCTNIKDFSFIKSAQQFTFKAGMQKHMAATQNFTGLPDNINICSIKLNADSWITDSDISKCNMFKDGNTCVGIPAKASISITIGSSKSFKPMRKALLSNIISTFSLEGLSDNQLLNGNIQFGRFFGRAGGQILQIGLNKLEPKVDYYSLTKPIRNYLIKTHSFFMECYDKDAGPTKEFDDSKIDDKIKQSVNNAELRKQHKKEDEELLLSMLYKQAQKYIHVDDKFKYGYSAMKIVNMNEQYIKFAWANMRRLNVKTYNMEWKKFFSMITSYNYRLENSDQSLKEVIIDPVMKKWEKVKEQLKEKRKLERKQKKESENIQVDTKVEEVPVETKKEFVPNPRMKVEIKPYSDKSIALFGNTYPIKDKIKELGGKYNPRLKYDEKTVKPGWIISKSKENEVKELIK